MNGRTTIVVGFLSLYAISAALFVAWFGHPRTAEHLPQSLVTSGAAIYPLFVLASAPMAVLGGLLWFRKSLRVTATTMVCAAVGIFVSAHFVQSTGWGHRREWLQRVAEEAEPLLRTLADSDRSRAPGLVRAHRSPSLGTRTLEYHEVDGTWELSLVSPTQFGTTDRFFYRADHIYPQSSRDGWYEKIGTWAYLHDEDQ